MDGTAASEGGAALITCVPLHLLLPRRAVVCWTLHQPAPTAWNRGLARGGAPRARIAVYKAVWGKGRGAGAANTATLLAAIDDAIHDGVDVLSLSLTSEENSFGALHGVQKGIAVVYAAGNFGPASQVVRNTAPWVITVAASQIDRSFPTMITLGNKQQIVVRNTTDNSRFMT